MTAPAPDDPDARPPAAFPTTHWSLVVAAGRGADSPGAFEALADLCEAYWYPLYIFARRRGHDPDEAADLVQGTFADLLDRRGLAAVDPALGRFRSYLMAACAHHIADQMARARAAKRGGGRPVVSIDLPAAEGRYRLEPSHGATPERLYERRWAVEMIERGLARLEAEMDADGKSALGPRLLPTLTGVTAPYSAIAADLGMTVGAVKAAAHRLRRRFAAALRAEVARTVSDPAEVDAELADLMAALAR